MNPIDVAERPPDPIFGPISKVVSSIDAVGRMVTFSKCSESPDAAIDKLKNILQKTLQQLATSSVESVKETMKTALEEIKHLPTVYDIYVNMIDSTTTAETLSQCARKYIKDVSALKTLEVSQTTLGGNGPTFLISYSIFNKIFALNAEFSPCKRRAYVLKWTNKDEICSSRLYDAISQNLIDHQGPQSIFVPKNVGLDFDKLIHDRHDCSHYSIEQEAGVHLKQSFLAIMGKNREPGDTQIMVVEKINGSNLFDFASTKYSLLETEQRYALFKKLGQLTALDLLFGHGDRLYCIAYSALNGYGFSLKLFSTNPGNIMIEWDANSAHSPKLYAIDNGYDPETILSMNHQKAYNEFVKYHLVYAKTMDGIADTIVTEISKTFYKKLPNSGGPLIRQKLGRALAPFLEDVKNPDIAKPAVTEGLLEMREILNRSLPAFWNSDSSLGIRTYLESSHPEFLVAFSERVKIFNGQKK